MGGTAHRAGWVLAFALVPSAPLACGGHREAATQAGDAPVAASVHETTAAQPGVNDVQPVPGAGLVDPVPVPAPAPPPPGPEQAGQCPDRDDPSVGLLISPRRPASGQPVRVLAATFAGEDALALRVEDGQGAALDADVVHRPGVPASAVARLTAGAAGRLRVVVGRGGTGFRCATVRVAARADKRDPRRSELERVWPIKRAWTAAEEALYSAWLQELFYAPRGEDLAFGALHEVTSRPERNLLHDHFGWGEDGRDHEGGLFLRPDCADAPYFYRAYFSWKRALPFAFRKCSRGRGKAPKCGALAGIVGPREPWADPVRPGELGDVQRYFKRTLGWGVHSGNGRTAFEDDRTDLYGLRLDRRALRPGTIYADPYGHIFVIVALFPGHGAQPGVLYAVDGQPDGSITRKRFWEGNFLWNPDPALGGSGFKAFRPIVLERGDGGPTLVALSNEQIAASPEYGDVSSDQADLDAPAFYDLVERLVTPGRRDPFVVQREAVRALHEAAKVRVTSVENGERYHRDHPGKIIDMPDGAAIFETTGPWENYSTPARDLRLLIAIDVVRSFDAKVARQPAVYGVEAGPRLEKLTQALAKDRQTLLEDADLGFGYGRSDGSTVDLTLSQLVERGPALEVGYNPNDCAEVRWGAAAGSDEASTCDRRAPAPQRRKMEAYRVWFRERRRPPRGDPGPAVDGADAGGSG